MHTRSIATSTLWQLGSQAVTMVLSIVSIKFVTIALSQSLVGNYQTVWSYLQIFGILADFGLYAVAVREFSKAKDPGLTLGTLFVLRAGITLLSLGGAIGIAFALPGFGGTPLPLGIAIAVFVPFFTLLSGMLRTLFQVRYQMHYVFLAEVCSKFVPVCLIGLSLIFGARLSDNLNFYYAFLGFGGIGSFILFLFSLRFARPLLDSLGKPDEPELRPASRGLFGVHPRFSGAEFFRILKLSAPYGIAFLMTTIYRQSDITLIALLRPQDYDIQNAHYGIVMRLTEVGFLLPTLIMNSALPVMSTGGRSDMEDFLGKLLLSLLTLGSIISLFSFFLARPLILLITQESYLSTPLSFGSDTALQLMAFPMFLGMIITFCFYLLLHEHRWKWLLTFTTFSAALSVTFNSALIPQFGFMGAAMTSVFIHLFLTTGLLIVSLRFTKVSIPFSKLCQWFAFSLVTGLSLFAMAPFITSSLSTILLSGAMLGFSLVLLFLFGLPPANFVGVTRH